MEEKRRIAIIVGSKSDLTQCEAGLEFLEFNNPGVDVIGVYVRSQHRNTLKTQELLEKLVSEKVDAIIVGAGWANHLTGCCDAFLRYQLKAVKPVVIGVAFEDPKDERHDQAAILSITEVPGTQVVYKDELGIFTGSKGFLRACRASARELPTIKLPDSKPTLDMTLEEARLVVLHGKNKIG